jgi:hypothetical protein
MPRGKWMMMGYENVAVAGYHDPIGSTDPVCRCILAQPYADHPDFRDEWRLPDTLG